MTHTDQTGQKPWLWLVSCVSKHWWSHGTPNSMQLYIKKAQARCTYTCMCICTTSAVSLRITEVLAFQVRKFLVRILLLAY